MNGVDCGCLVERGSKAVISPNISYNCEVMLTDSTCVVARYCVVIAELEVDRIRKAQEASSSKIAGTNVHRKHEPYALQRFQVYTTSFYNTLSRQQLHSSVCRDAR
jgi:hypothetical protein